MLSWPFLQSEVPVLCLKIAIHGGLPPSMSAHPFRVITALAPTILEHRATYVIFSVEEMTRPTLGHIGLDMCVELQTLRMSMFIDKDQVSVVLVNFFTLFGCRICDRA